jgi:cation:H+ antiporter
LPATPMSKSGFFAPLFAYADQAMAYWRAGLEQLSGWYHLAEALNPWFPLAVFIICSMLMVYRLNVLERKGLEGTVLGTLVMPYASGFPNLMFAFSLGRQGGSGSVIVENCIVNNVTNLTLLIGLPALIWTLNIIPSRSAQTVRTPMSKLQRLNTLSLILTLVALFFFTGALWALGRDGNLDFGDGLVLVGIFLFWQVLHIFDVLKYNIHQRRSLPWTIMVDTLLVVALGVGVLSGIDRLVAWVMALGPGFVLYDQLGILSGCLMVLPNAVLAAYYAWAGRADIVYSSQVGDGHICIPMCIGLFALFSVIQVPDQMNMGIMVILGAGLLHLFFVSVIGRLPRIMGALLTIAYGVFLYTGFMG